MPEDHRDRVCTSRHCLTGQAGAATCADAEEAARAAGPRVGVRQELAVPVHGAGLHCCSVLVVGAGAQVAMQAPGHAKTQMKAIGMDMISHVASC